MFDNSAAPVQTGGRAAVACNSVCCTGKTFKLLQAFSWRIRMFLGTHCNSSQRSMVWGRRALKAQVQVLHGSQGTCHALLHPLGGSGCGCAGSGSCSVGTKSAGIEGHSEALAPVWGTLQPTSSRLGWRASCAEQAPVS